jgi:hypothetical protein
MAYLIADKIIKEGGLVINQKLTPDGYHKKPNREMNIQGVTVHNTGSISTSKSTNPAEQYARATYPNGNMGWVAVHYWVHKGIIWQQLRDDEQGWHAGGTIRQNHRGKAMGGNRNTISIEIIGDDPESEETGKKLVALLCKRHKLDPMLDVYTHNWWMHGVDKVVAGARKNCPIYILDHWADFIKDVDHKLNPVQEQKPAPVDVEFASGLVKIIYAGEDGVNVRKTPDFGDNIDQVVEHGEVFTVVGETDRFYKLKSGLYLAKNENLVEYIPNKQYVIRVTADALHYRSGPGMQHSINGKIYKGGVYTIVDEQDGWGKLKSGAGWISLAYTEKK